MEDNFRELNGKYQDRRLYTYDVDFVPFDEQTKNDIRVVTDYINKNKGRDRYSRLKPYKFRVKENTIGMLAPPSSNIGYVLLNSDMYWDFVFDLYESLYQDVEDEEKKALTALLVNYSVTYCYVPHMVKSSRHRVDDSFYPSELMESCKRVYTEWFDQALLRDPSLIKVKAKKLSAIGYPDEHVDGTAIKKEDYLVGIKGDQKESTKSVLRFYKDLSKIKIQWMKNPEGSKRILSKQIEYLSILKDQGIERIPTQDLPFLIENNMVSVHKPSARLNAPDSSVVIPNKVDRNTILYGKDRIYNCVTKEGIETGRINSKLYNTIVKNEFHFNGYANRGRLIEPSNNTMHVNGTILATSVVYDLERSCKGHPSDRPEVIEDHELFAAKFQDTHDLYIQGIDCENCEVTITTNSDLYMQLFPDWIRPYVSLTLTSIVPEEGFFNVVRDALNSAVWATSLYNILKGNMEMIRIIYHNLKKFVCGSLRPIGEVAEDYLHCLASNDKNCYVHFGSDIWINPKLGLDDVEAQIAIPKGSKKYQFDNELKVKTLINSDPSFSKINMFGMDITPYKMVVASSNKLAKLVHSERMGFVLKDGFATYTRMNNCGHKDVVDSVLKKHFGYGVDDYAIYEPLFRQWLKQHGLSVYDVFDEYSSTNRLLYSLYDISLEEDQLIVGSHVDKDTFQKSSRYDEQDIAEVLELFKVLRKKMC